MCYADRDDQIDNCGFNAFCFILWRKKMVEPYHHLMRGCDNTFFCDHLHKTARYTYEEEFNLSGVEVKPIDRRRKSGSKSSIQNGEEHEQYENPPSFGCIEDVSYMGLRGFLCCCNFDWCNKTSRREEISLRSRLQELGNGTTEEYDELLAIYDLAVGREALRKSRQDAVKIGYVIQF